MTTADCVRALRQALGPEVVLTDEGSLQERRYDQWAVKHLRNWLGQPVASPACVARPRGVKEVQRIVRLAGESGTPVIPFGLGSGVCGGIEPSPDAILLDMSAMNAVRFIDETNLLAGFDAGLNGLKAEEAVAAHGLTIGHWPQSVAISSVGGWVSTRASGQFSTAHGAIEDMIHTIEAVLPNGELVTLGKAPRAAAGPDLRHLLMGAEGTMGVITGVTLSLRREAEHRAYTAFYAADMDQGFEAQRRIIQADWLPPVVRQYDGPEVKRNFRDHARGEQAVIIMVHEGPRTRVEAEIAAVTTLAEAAGLTSADPAMTRDWMARRNHTPAWTDLFERGFVADTAEVSASWTDIGRVYRDVTASLREIPGIANASAHSSHVYRSGLNLYFSFAIRPPAPEAMEGAYFEAWRRIMEATAEAGGGIAHHHGIGRLRRPFLHHDLGEAGMDLLRTLKGAIDPRGVMNPGNLIADA